MKKILCIFLLLLSLVLSLASCGDNETNEPNVTVSEDGYVVINGVKTEHKVDTSDDITISDDGYVVVNGVKTDIIANKEDIITIDNNGYIVVNGIRTDYKPSVEYSSEILDPTKILIIESTENESARFVQVLDPIFQSTVVNISDPSRLPETTADMIEYGTVILFNIANEDMPAGFDETLYSYVSDFKGGILTVCGQELDDSGKWTAHAYTRKDMYGSLYQEMLPVEIIKYTPPTAVMILIDISGSMTNYHFEDSKLYSALTGAYCALDCLTERDYVGIIGFVESSEYYIDITPCVQRPKILSAIDRIEETARNGVGGSTKFTPALTDAGNALANFDGVENRHIILLTDGEPWDSTEEYGEAMRKNAERGITMSIVCIEATEDATKKLTEALVNYAGMPAESLYAVSEKEYVPSTVREDLFSTEIKDVKYETFTPTVTTYTDVLNNVNPADIPTLDGFYGSKLKEGATAVLSNEYVPIYAQWEFGSGTVGSFMCDLNGTWSDEFLSTECGQKIINNIIRSISYYQINDDENDLTYTDENPQGLSFFLKDDGTYAVEIGAAKYFSKIEIPILYKGHPVTEIGSFEGSTALKTVILPDTITKINDCAFLNCTNLSSINIPDTIEYIGEGAFIGCAGIEYNNALYIGNAENPYAVLIQAINTSIESAIIPDTTKFISAFAFDGCSKLTNVKVPDNTKSIGICAFRDCASLTSVTIGNSVTTIELDTFYNCTNLINISIPDSIEYIDYSAFEECPALEYNQYDNAFYLGNINNPFLVLIAPKNNDIVSCSIHDNAKIIMPDAFYFCKKLERLTIGNGITNINNCDYTGLSSLVELKIGDAVTSIGYGAFSGCTNLTTVSIGKNVKSIGANAFYNCTNLRTINIPDSVEQIGEYAFAGCTSLEYNPYDNALYLGNETNPYIVLIKASDQYIESINIHEDTKFIHSQAFQDCRVLTHVTIPNSVISIGDNAFMLCFNLSSVIIGDSVITIGDGAFRACKSLKNVIIGKSITYIGYSAFEQCKNITDIYYTGSEKEWSNISIGLYNNELTNATLYYYSETAPTIEGNFWHYVDGVPTVWK